LEAGGAWRIRFSSPTWTITCTITGFLHVERGLWRLAPAFDLDPFPDRARELKTWVSTDTGPEATIDALMSVIAYFRLSLPRAKKILRQVERAVAGWRASDLA
jgi:serine/threonine-protein kinase HipA